tara:strand:- start:92 stop:358 length:267 start_codon:yes stop_codon:yes gene_type:complete
MKLLKIVVLTLMLSTFNITSYAFEEDCNTIKQNIVKKLACKAMGGSSGTSESNSSEQSESLIEVETEEKTGMLSKIWKKPYWMKKKKK